MRVAITGASGMVGTALAHALRAEGHVVVPISRQPAEGGAWWDPERHEIEAAALRGADAVVHLIGEGIARRRWTPERKQRLRDSRVPTTRWLAGLLAALRPRPEVLVSASAIGIYGRRAEGILDEQSMLGDDFLARLARDWEDAADPARDAGIRVINPRFGMVLSTTGGALAKMLPFFRSGLGGRFGSGRQWMSWITIDDVVAGIQHAFATRSLDGPVNFTTPNPVENSTFARALGRALHRPAILPVPALALRIALGEMADATLLANQRAIPAALERSGYLIQFPEIDVALDHVCRPHRLAGAPTPGAMAQP